MKDSSLKPATKDHACRGVIGIMKKDRKYLMIRRAQGIAKAGCWCFPGGHIKRNEIASLAIQRELREELGINVSPVARLGSIRITRPDYILAVWLVEHLSGTLKPAINEVAEYRWVTQTEIATLSPGLPSNLKVVEMLKA